MRGVRFLRVVLVFFVALMLLVMVFSLTVQAQLRSPTTLTLSPSTFEIEAGKSITLTATLTSEGEPLADKLIKFSASAGSVDPSSGKTDSKGQIKVVYTAPKVSYNTSVVIEAVFPGDLKYKESSASAYGKIIVKTPITLPKVSVEGAVFIPTKEMEEEIESYRQTIPEEMPSNVFILLAKDGIYLVFCKEKPVKSLGYVEGKTLRRSFEWKDITFKVIVADKVSFKVEGEPATIKAIRSDPSAYNIKLVKLRTNLREASVLIYSGNEPYIYLTSGVVTDEPTTLPEFLSKLPSAMRKIAEKPLLETAKSLLGEIEEKTLPTFTYDDVEFWKDSWAEVNCVVLASKGYVKEFLSKIGSVKDLVPIGENILLYKVKLDLNPILVSDVREINVNPSKYLGRTVQLTVNVYDLRISVRKLIEESTEKKYPADVILHIAVAWSKSIPTSKNDILLMIGASSHVQEDLAKVVDGVFKVEGKVVSAKQIDESLPEKPVLLIFKMVNIGEINYEALAVEAKKLIEGEVKTLNETLCSLILGKPLEQPRILKPRIETPSSSVIKVPTIDMFEVAEKGFQKVVIDVDTTIAPELKEVIVSISGCLTREIPLEFNLANVIRKGRLSRELTLTLNNETGKFSLHIYLPKEVKSPETIIMKPVISPPKIPSGWVKVLPVIDIGPSGTIFDKPVTLSFTYSDEVVKKFGIDEELLTIMFFDETLRKWVPLDSFVDCERNIIYTQITHFTMYTVAQKLLTPTATPSSSPSPSPTPSPSPSPSPTPTTTPSPTPTPSPLPTGTSLTYAIPVIAVIGLAVVLLLRKR